MTNSELCQRYDTLVRSIAASIAKRAHYRVDPDDLYSEGMLGLFQAWAAFDPKRGNRFSTFAQHRVRGAMIDAVRKNDWVPRLCRTRSRAAHEKIEDNYKATGEWKIEGVRPMPRKHYRKRGGAVWGHVRGYDDLKPIEMGGKNEFPHIDRNAANPYVSAERSDSIRHLVRHLSRDQRFVVLSSVVHGLTLKDVGTALGVSQSRVSQIRTEALKSLRGRLSGTIAAMSPDG